MRCAAVIVAGGSGERAGGELKQFRMLAGRPVLMRALAPFLDHPEIDAVQVVLRTGSEDAYRAAVDDHPRLRPPVAGGARRQDSARRGLEALAEVRPDYVLIHDAARPFATAALITRVIGALSIHPGAVPGLAVTNSLKKRDQGGTIETTVDRAGLYAAQTPQGFRYAAILDAHSRAADLPEEFTDDASVAEWAGLSVAIVPGEATNRKLTTPEDFALAEMLLNASAETRGGTGYNVHRFGIGDHVMLCGVRVPHEQGLVGHSDADVGLHALTDAILGAIADGDIGSHFPPSDPKWRGAESGQFLRHAAALVRARGGRVVNVNVTLICEAPKVGPHRDAMRARIAELLDVPAGRVAVKATTSEGLGFTGRSEGIAAQAVATVSLPAAETDR